MVRTEKVQQVPQQPMTVRVHTSAGFATVLWHGDPQEPDGQHLVEWTIDEDIFWRGTGRFEAGGEPWSRVRSLLDRRTSEIAAGGVIEILTTDPGVRTALPGWCARHGAVLETTSQRDGTVGYLVRLVGGRPGEHT